MGVGGVGGPVLKHGPNTADAEMGMNAHETLRNVALDKIHMRCAANIMPVHGHFRRRRYWSRHLCRFGTAERTPLSQFDSGLSA
jgi:hypothetical protein